MQLTRDSVAAIVVMSFAFAAHLYALTFPVEAQIFPRAVTVILLLAGGMLLFRSLRNPDRNARSPLTSHAPRLLLGILLTFIYLTTVNLLGFYTTSVIFIPTAAYLLGYRKPLTIVLCTTGFILAMWIAFTWIFEMQLPTESLLRVL